jgi:hypothetical protein
VFHGLLPEPHNLHVVHLLHLCAKWHSLAKLRLHTDNTLHLLDKTTTELGEAFREFVNKTCKAFQTRELKREAEARQRRQLRTNKLAEASTCTRRPKSFNLQTYKFHALGDYAATIRRYGTCDSYTTEIVSARREMFSHFLHLKPVQGELEHRCAKANYARTDRREFIKQMAQIERRQARIRRIYTENFPDAEANDDDVALGPESHYNIGKTENLPLHMSPFVQRHSGDPAIEVCAYRTNHEHLLH